MRRSSMEIVEPGTYGFDLGVSFPTPVKDLSELPGSMSRDSEWTTFRRATGKTTVKEPVEKDALAERLAAVTFKGLASEDVTVAHLELIPTLGPTVAEQVVLDYLDCIRVAGKHVDSCVACQNEQHCEAGEPILYHF